MTKFDDELQAKYARHSTPEHRAAMQAVGIARAMLGEHRERYDALLESKRQMDNVGWLLDPTLYRDVLASRRVARQIRMAEAALAFLREVDAVADETAREGADAENPQAQG